MEHPWIGFPLLGIPARVSLPWEFLYWFLALGDPAGDVSEHGVTALNFSALDVPERGGPELGVLTRGIPVLRSKQASRREGLWRQLT
jgi:hypothetical protein